MKKSVLISLIPGVSRLFASVVPILLLFIYTKTSETKEIGLINYFISLTTIIGVLTDFGLPEALQKYLPEKKENHKLIFPIFVLEFVIIMFSLILVSKIDYFTGGALSRGYLEILLLSIFFSAANVIVITYNGLKDKIRLSV